MNSKYEIVPRDLNLLLLIDRTLKKKDIPGNGEDPEFSRVCA